MKEVNGCVVEGWREEGKEECDEGSQWVCMREGGRQGCGEGVNGCVREGGVLSGKSVGMWWREGGRGVVKEVNGCVVEGGEMVRGVSGCL